MGFLYPLQSLLLRLFNQCRTIMMVDIETHHQYFESRSVYKDDSKAFISNLKLQCCIMKENIESEMKFISLLNAHNNVGGLLHNPPLSDGREAWGLKIH
ncbi:hypothetical protein NPIL_175551 [Nephila pilipes]|uniref:Uncharacterized protein n=1 Tax=Nephila pilipes TaxID=299642 RepID=A0A8X6MMX9_NEPPI|nr:hypothetical protein NPIL_175551 [Nephila pilipes]